ncbi:MAG: FoF1 ATP synthase subunit gamma, partial [Myxococcota bacterium]
MANLKAIRKRIGTVKSTQKITRAMKMVAGARLNRAQRRITELRPYAVKTQEVLSQVTAAGRQLAAAEDRGDDHAAVEEEERHPLLDVRPERRVVAQGPRQFVANRQIANVDHRSFEMDLLPKIAFSRGLEPVPQSNQVDGASLVAGPADLVHFKTRRGFEAQCEAHAPHVSRTRDDAELKKGRQVAVGVVLETARPLSGGLWPQSVPDRRSQLFVIHRHS